MAAKRGRPPKPENERLSAHLRVRVTVDQREEIEALAAELGVTISELVVARVLKKRIPKKA